MPFNRIAIPPAVLSGLADQCRPALTAAAADLTWTAQAALVFGSDRKDPVSFRPALVKRRNAPTHAVLPGTTDKQIGKHERFFYLPRDSDGVTPYFGRSIDEDTFLYRVAETVRSEDLGEKMAAISPNLNNEIERWYRDCGGLFRRAPHHVVKR